MPKNNYAGPEVVRLVRKNAALEEENRWKEKFLFLLSAMAGVMAGSLLAIASATGWL